MPLRCPTASIRRNSSRSSTEIDEEGWELLGIVHTHTHSEAAPSETDRKLAFYPDARYLIMSLSDRERPVLRAFRISEGDVAEEELRIT